MTPCPRPSEDPTAELHRNGLVNPAPKAGMALLSLRAGRAELTPVGPAGLVIGHDPRCDVVIASRFVSRRHCRLRPCGVGVRVEDLASRNGTFVDDARVGEAELREPARLLIGGEPLVVVPTLQWGNDAPVAHLGDMVARAEQTLRVFHAVLVTAPHRDAVLVAGPSGCGKELVARALHAADPRRSRGPFVALNCGALPAGLVEAELFGAERGAYTGAERTRVGAFRSADGGTLFLDEVGELPLGAQPALLRVLETGEVRPVGADRALRPDVRVVCATNRDLSGAVEGGAFRRDLFFRLNPLTLRVPPLIERPADIVPIARYLVWRASGQARVLSAEAEAVLAAGDWSGNVRQLRNALRAALIATARPVVGPDDLPDLRATAPFSQAVQTEGSGAVAGCDDARLLYELRRQLGSRRATYESLGMARSTFYYRLRKLRQEAVAASPPAELH